MVGLFFTFIKIIVKIYNIKNNFLKNINNKFFSKFINYNKNNNIYNINNYIKNFKDSHNT